MEKRREEATQRANEGMNMKTNSSSSNNNSRGGSSSHQCEYLMGYRRKPSGETFVGDGEEEEIRRRRRERRVDGFTERSKKRSPERLYI